MLFPEIEAMPGLNEQHQIDCIGYVVAKEDPKNMVTKAGQATTCMTLYLEDLEKNKMKCTVFRDMVGELAQLAARDDVQPLIVVAQLFKSSVYLNETHIQNTRYMSQVFLNPDFPEVAAFRKSLLALGESATQGITHVESQPQYSAENELEGGARAITTIEDVMNQTDETSCWILAEIVSVEGGPNGWCYLSCFNCVKKVVEVKNGYQCPKCKRIIVDPTLRFRLHAIIIGQTAKEIIDSEKGKHDNSQPKVIQSLLEKKFLFKVAVSAQNVISMDYMYAVERICDDEALIGVYSSANSMEIGGMHQSASNMLPIIASAEADSQASGPGIVSLSKDTNSQGAFEDGGGSPEIAVGEDIIPSGGLSGLASPEISHSCTRSGRRVVLKRKFD
ncbi:hypothetical protein PIB30_038934 [Stylosanthes scabra]|uniref:Replication factor A C-terminal domain-containing protein n=1 Tax=Stylosanthes scabra TaxID=79078 RepID=A0ABU6TEX2_9FABA|nr:hypothetical protein [Stylosanthes scabra]